MKLKPTLLMMVAVATSAISCSLSVSDMENPEPFSESSTFVSIDEAEKELMLFLDTHKPETRSVTQKRIRSRYSTSSKVKTRAGETEERPLVHIFNFEDDAGYAIMSGDSRVSPVLCVTEKGSLEVGDTITNPGLAIVLTIMETDYRIKTGMLTSDRDVDEHVSKRTLPIDTTDYAIDGHTYEYGNWQYDSSVGTVIGCQWGQGYKEPYNSGYGHKFNGLCPTKSGYQTLAGCVPIAVAQIMYYWGENTTYAGTYYDWSVMRDITSRSSSPSDPNAWSLVQSLIRDLGNSENLDVDYGLDASGANKDNVPRTFVNFGYSSGGQWVDINENSLIAALSQGPVLCAGFADKKEIKVFGITIFVDYSNGHAWIIDRVSSDSMPVHVSEGGVYHYTYYLYRHYFHINWGWDGDSDGFFNLFDLNTSNAVSRPDGYNHLPIPDSMDFQYMLQMNCGIRP